MLYTARRQMRYAVRSHSLGARRRRGFSAAARHQGRCKWGGYISDSSSDSGGLSAVTFQRFIPTRFCNHLGINPRNVKVKSDKPPDLGQNYINPRNFSPKIRETPRFQKKLFCVHDFLSSLGPALMTRGSVGAMRLAAARPR